jgi:hypothetical protein
MKLAAKTIAFWALSGCSLLALQFVTPYLAEELRSLVYVVFILLAAVYILSSILRKRKAGHVPAESLEKVEQALLHETENNHIGRP